MKPAEGGTPIPRHTTKASALRVSRVGRVLPSQLIHFISNMVNIRQAQPEDLIAIQACNLTCLPGEFV
jgi:hypothetical protein